MICPEESATCASLAALIRRQRLARDWSLQQLADRAGCTKAYIWDMERGGSSNPTLTTLIGLARAFGMPTSKLVGQLDGERDGDQA